MSISSACACRWRNGDAAMNPIAYAPIAQLPQRRPDAGFTLIEVLVVTAIMGILLTIGMPGLRSLMDNQKMKSATFDLVTTVMQARSEAVKYGTTSGASISIVAQSGNYNNGWCIVFTSSSACSVSAPGGDVMRVNAATANVTYTVFSCSATPCVITFGRTGRLSSGSAVKIRVDNDDTSNLLTRCVTIDTAGNASTKVGVCT